MAQALYVNDGEYILVHRLLELIDGMHDDEVKFGIEVYSRDASCEDGSNHYFLLRRHLQFPDRRDGKHCIL